LKNIDKKVGTRLKLLRGLVNLNRTAASKILKIPEITLRKWELGNSRLTSEGVKRCVSAYRAHGLVVKSEWLLFGQGEKPFKLELSKLENIDNSVDLEMLKVMNDKSGDFFSYIDKDEKFRLANSRYETIFNKPISEVIGKSLKETIGLQGYNVCKPFVNLALSGRNVQFEYPWEFQPNQYRYLKLEYLPHKNIDGTVVGFFSFIEDVQPKFNSNTLSSILPYIENKPSKYVHSIFIDCFNLVNKYLEFFEVQFTEYELFEITQNVYKKAMQSKSIKVEKYIKKIIESAIDSGVLKTIS
jgi:PAS domain-containing protein